MPKPLFPQVPFQQHGGGGAPDFSVNANPFGPNPRLVQASASADLDYPERTLGLPRERLAWLHGLKPSQVALGLGASELLYRSVRAFVPPGGLALSVLAPFGELTRALRLQGASLEVIAPGGDWPGIPQLVYLSRPHNPSGLRISRAELEALAERCWGAGALLVLDEAYAPLHPQPEPDWSHPALLRLQSPGKAHGAVGLRMAYALGEPEIVAALENLLPAWPLPSPTVAALSALPEAQGWLAETLPRWRDEAQRIAGALAGRWPLQHSGLPFLSVQFPAQRAQRLQASGFGLRELSSYGQPGWWRICARLPQDNDLLLEAALGGAYG